VTRGAEGTGATALPDTSVVIEAATGGDFDAVDAALESVAAYSNGTADHLTAQLGTSSNRQDAYVDALDGQSISTDGPVEMSSEYASIQAALDAAAGGTLFINDTKTEEDIRFDSQHNYTTIWFVGGNAIEQPASPSASAVMQGNNNSNEVVDVTIYDLEIYNPNLSDGDINNVDTTSGAFVWNTSDVTTGAMRDWTFINPTVHHVQGDGIGARNPAGTLRVINPTVHDVGNDGVRARTPSTVNDGVEIIFENIDCRDVGRHATSISGDARASNIRITGYGENTYLGIVDLEEGQNVSLDVRGKNSNLKGGTGEASSGLNVGADSENVTGYFEVVNPGQKGAHIQNHVDDLTVVTRRTDGNAQNPQNQAAVEVTNTASGTLNAEIYGGGSDKAALAVVVPTNMDIDAHVEEAYAASYRCYRHNHAKVNLTSIDPAQGGASLAADFRTHVHLSGSASTQVENMTYHINAEDANGNAEHVVVGDAGNAASNLYLGSAAGAYTSATPLENLAGASRAEELIT